jgi:hypothetical protein
MKFLCRELSRLDGRYCCNATNRPFYIREVADLSAKIITGVRLTRVTPRINGRKIGVSGAARPGASE